MNPYIILSLLCAALLAIGAWQQKKKAALYEISWAAQTKKTITGKSFLLQMTGFVCFIASWHVTVVTLSLPWFNRLPGPWECLLEWLSPDPDYGISIYTKACYLWVFLF